MFSALRAAVVMVSLHINRTLTKTEICTRQEGVDVECLTMLLVCRMQTSELCDKKAIEFFMWGSMGCTSRNIERSAVAA